MRSMVIFFGCFVLCFLLRASALMLGAEARGGSWAFRGQPAIPAGYFNWSQNAVVIFLFSLFQKLHCRQLDCS